MIDPTTQTSAVVGVAVVGRTVVGVVLSQTGGLSQSGGRANPWRVLPVQTTTWTPL